jgi:hypothetical protein
MNEQVHKLSTFLGGRGFNSAKIVTHQFDGTGQQLMKEHLL